MRLDDFGLGVLMLMAGAAIYASALQFSPIPGQAYGAETMPKAISVLAGGVGLFLTSRAIAAGARRPHLDLADWTRSPAALGGLAITLGLIGIYILVSGRTGFAPVAFASMLVLMLILRTRLAVAVLVSLVATLVIQQAFGRLLLVPLPRSPFLPFLW